MAVVGWAVVLPVYEQPHHDLPGDTRLHRLCEPARHAHAAEPPLHVCLRGVTTLLQLHATSTEGPTMVWHHSQPDSHYWTWVTRAQHTVLTATHTPPPEPWVELLPGAVALF